MAIELREETTSSLCLETFQAEEDQTLKSKSVLLLNNSIGKIKDLSFRV